MGVFKETADLLGLAFLFDFLKDAIERIKKLFIPPRAFSWQTMIYLSLFSWLMSALANGSIESIIAFFGWVFLIAGTSWYTTDKPLYIPGTIMPVGAVITGGIVSVFAFQRGDEFISRTIIFWPTISALITAVPEFFEGSGTDVKTQLPDVNDRESVIILIGCCMLLSCWLNLYEVTDTWLNEYPSARYSFEQNETARRNDLLTVIEPEDQIPPNGVLIINKLQSGVETALDGKSWSEVERWLKNANRRVSQLGGTIIKINLREFEEKEFWKTEANVQNIVPEDINSGYRLDLYSIWEGPSATKNGYHLRRSCQIEPIAERDESISSKGEMITVAELECLPKISYIAGQPKRN
jgi:hypothetical protein